MLAFNVRVGQFIEMKHVDHGDLGVVRVDHKSGDAVRLIFDMPRAVRIRVMNQRVFGINGAREPLQAIA